MAVSFEKLRIALKFCISCVFLANYVPKCKMGSVPDGLIFEISDVTWSQKSTLVYTLNPELMHRSIITDVLMCCTDLPKSQFVFGYVSRVTISDILKFIIEDQVGHQI